MAETNSIWRAPLNFSDEGVFARAGGAAPRLAAACAAVFILSPLPAAAPCAFAALLGEPENCVKVILLDWPTLFQRALWPLAALLAAAALFFAWGTARRRGGGLRRFARENPAFACFAALLAWMLLSTAANGLSAEALVGSGLRYETIFMQLGYFALLFPAATLIPDAAKRRLARAHELVSLALVLTALILRVARAEAFGVSAVFSNINYYGYYLSVSIPLSAALFVAEEKPLWKALAAFALAANTVALSYNATMGAWVACAAAMLFLLVTHGILERRLNAQALAMALLFALCLYLPGRLNGNFTANTAQLGGDILKIVTHAEGAEHAGSGRWIIWRRGLALIRAHPVFGLGFEGVDARGLEEYARNTRVHNEYLQYALFYGIPAGATYFAGCFGVYLLALRRRARLAPMEHVCLTAAFGYLCSAFFGLTLFGTAPFLFLFLGMGCARSETHMERETT